MLINTMVKKHTNRSVMEQTTRVIVAGLTFYGYVIVVSEHLSMV